MKTRYRAALVAMFALCVISATVWYPVGLASQRMPQTSETQTTMRGIFFTLTMVYTYSLDPEAFQDPGNQVQIRSALQALVANASELESHGGGLNASYGYFRRSLARDAQDALNRYNQGQYMGARFVISRITENCISCHTKLPSKQEFDLGKEFINQKQIRKLKPEERVQIEVALRQFHAALNTYEQLFADPEMTPENLSLLSAFSGYLKVCVGVLDDPQRAIETLTKYSERADLPEPFKSLVTGWIAELRAVDLQKAKGNELAVSKKLIEDAEASRKHPSDRSRLVDYIVASTLLHRYIETNPSQPVDVAEAYYLMGIAEARISRSYWVSETDFLLEQAIRAAPKSDVAKKAYAFLSEYTIAGHAETSAREVSPDLRANLEELRKLIEE
jgi:tetratricopeptide (TPR) repeat protein